MPLAGALVVAGLVGALATTQPDWAESRSMSAVARGTVQEMGPGDGRPVRIAGFGFVPTLGAAPAVAWEAHRAGWEPHFLSAWPFEEDAEHLWTESTPDGATELFIVDSAEPELQEGVPGTARKIVTVDQSHRDGTIMVYLAKGD